MWNLQKQYIFTCETPVYSIKENHSSSTNLIVTQEAITYIFKVLIVYSIEYIIFTSALAYFSFSTYQLGNTSLVCSTRNNTAFHLTDEVKQWNITHLQFLAWLTWSFINSPTREIWFILLCIQQYFSIEDFCVSLSFKGSHSIFQNDVIQMRLIKTSCLTMQPAVFRVALAVIIVYPSCQSIPHRWI